MPRTQDSTTVELPAYLRDLLARERLHPRQALHEVIEEAFFYWKEHGGWAGLPGPWSRP